MHDGRKALVCIRRQKLGELFHANIYERAVLWLASAQRFLNQNSLRFNALQGVVDIKSVTDILAERTFMLPYPSKHASCSQANYFLSDFTNW